MSTPPTPLAGAALRDVLERERPTFHGPADAEKLVSLSVSHDVLALLDRVVEPGFTTLETGCGASTVVFAAKGCQHTVIAPRACEHERIFAWCHAHGISTTGVTSLAVCSQDVLPSLETPPLDLVLIDGLHGFPAPFIDWYYACRHLAVGGLLVVDDTKIITGRILDDYLTAEIGTGRWALGERFANTTVFRKQTADAVGNIGWIDQPYCVDRRPRPTPRQHLVRILRRLGPLDRAVRGLRNRFRNRP